MNCAKLLGFLLAIAIAKPAVAQTDSTALATPEAAKLAQKELVFYWVSRSCPEWMSPFDTTYYGFEVSCVGYGITKAGRRHNRQTIRKINRVYGKNWFEERFRPPDYLLRHKAEPRLHSE